MVTAAWIGLWRSSEGGGVRKGVELFLRELDVHLLPLGFARHGQSFLLFSDNGNGIIVELQPKVIRKGVDAFYVNVGVLYGPYLTWGLQKLARHRNRTDYDRWTDASSANAVWRTRAISNLDGHQDVFEIARRDDAHEVCRLVAGQLDEILPRAFELLDTDTMVAASSTPGRIWPTRFPVIGFALAEKGDVDGLERHFSEHDPALGAGSLRDAMTELARVRRQASLAVRVRPETES